MLVIFIVGPNGKAYIDTYNDTIKVTSKRPWLANVPKSRWLNEDGTLNGKRDHVRIDYASAYATRWLLEKKYKTEIDFKIVPANMLTRAIIKKSDLVFHHWYDKLVRPPIQTMSTQAKPNSKYQKLIDSGGDKMFPPIKYQHLTYDKCAYYKFFQSRGINTAPTVCVTRAEYNKNRAMVLNKIWRKSREWKEMFGKPVHGTDSGDVGRPHDFVTKTGLESYIAGVFSSKNRYPAIVFQKFMVDFELNFPQIRLYYLGDKYQYSVVEWKTPRPNGTSRLSNIRDSRFVSKAKTFAKKVLDSVKPFYQGAPKFLTRIDVGCCIQENKINADSLFLNEIEILAGLYLFYDGVKRLNFDYKMGEQALKVIEHFRKKI
tara:strand:- start:1179 stop:2297 length:1119 start_codon:yes stop_codon:yes gene_type:complete